MINLLRQNQRVLMLVIAILTIIAFIWLYNPANTRKLGVNSVAQIYGRTLTQADIDREVKNFQLALALGQFELLSELGGMAQNENQALNEFIWNLLVLQHQAREMGVQPTDTQVADRIKSLPVFQTSGQFDPRKYAAFVDEQLGPRGLTERQLEEIIRDSLRLERIRNIIGAPMAVSRGEVQEAERVFQKIDGELVRFSLAAAEASASVTEEEINGFYQRNQATLLAPETRMVQYVEFAPGIGQLPPEGKERIDAIQKLADTASAFVEQAAKEGFDKAAVASGLTVKTSPEFDHSGASKASAQIGGSETGEIIETLRSMAPAAFLLTEESPLSDVIQSGEKFFVVKLAAVNPQRPLSLEEVRPLIEARIRAMKAERLVQSSADAVLAKVREALAGGKSFAEAAAAAGLTPEPFSGLSASSGKLDQNQQEIIRAALLMEPGQLSGFIAAPDGGFAVYLASRAALDSAELARQNVELEPDLLDNKRRLLFASWLASAREEAKIATIQHTR